MPEPTAEHIAWWLENFSDETLADILSLLGRRLVLRSGVARVRAVFVAEGLARPVRVLSSVSERAGALAA
jgi:hypothetical protein